MDIKWNRCTSTYGNYIVWEDYRNNGASIYLQNLVTKVQTRISTNGYEPAIYGNKVVWYTYYDVDGTYSICIYDIVSKKTSIIIPKVSTNSLSIYGNRIMFNNYDGVTKLYDFVTKKYIPLPFSHLSEPNMYSNKIVYDDWNGNVDIYMATI